MRERAPTGLLGKLVLMLLVSSALSKDQDPCTKCYHPIYDGEELKSLFRVHTNINPSCFNHSQLITCREDGKVYWTTKNTASYRQRLLGECPVGESWFCFEQEGLKDLVKEKQLDRENYESHTPEGKNLFIDLVEKISKELNLTECWVSGSTQMTEIWPWEGISLSALEILRWKQTKLEYESLTSRGREKWDLKSEIIGEECILRTGKKYNTPVGKMACKRYLIIKNSDTKWVPKEPNTYWTAGQIDKGCIYHEGYKLYKCPAKRMNPFWGIKELSKFWECPDEISDGFWQAPEYLFWICGDTAYTKLPEDWTGSCTIGVIKPAFFLLPKKSGAHLGVPIYDDLRKDNRKKRNIIDMGGTQVWKSRMRTPEEIIQTYGPATWAQDGSWGYRTPIYMLNRIIRLQAILEKVSNQTALVFEHISDQLTQTRTVIYQIRLAVDYLLADEGGICGKFNSSECCLEIDDKSEVIKNISKEIRKLAYVGNQEWTPLINSNWWDEFWSFKGTWWKKAAFITVCSIAGLLFLPCLFPCLVRILTSAVQASIQSPESNNQKQAKIMLMESQEQKHETAREIYNKYQKLRKFYFQESETVN
ncbi:endogenous retrovirus group 3 member 1 Env polyprotein-like [Serinus canaria]|uniref:endogenous retrovirus group 3 member 1 Env polyprotein-like n=1 Tax=Serinus canaria TaxID=9135 RepID=UPI0021CC7B73|nr:endogenous retrovirus group 3 member 1 Env polyprotein-like [Serinus canaria]